MNSVSLIAKSLHNHARQIRVWFRLAHCRQVKQRWLQSAVRPTCKRKTCLLDIRQILFDGPQGRRFHALVTFLDRQGYEVWLVPHLGFLQTGLKSFKWSALKRARPYDVEKSPSYFDLCLSDRRSHDSRAGRTLLLTHQTHRPLDTDEVSLPFAFHPELMDLEEDRQIDLYRVRKRRWLLFFGGGHGRIAYPAASYFKYVRTVNRHRLVQLCLDHFSDRVIRPLDGDQLDALRSQEVNGFVFADQTKYRIPAEKWLTAVSHASFFLAAPGSRYPMSHNCVEAMAVGTIPILEYTQLFQPNLQDGVNCLSFHGEQGFVAALGRAETMPADEIRRIRFGAMDYYDRHLSAESVTRKLQWPRSTSKLHVFPYLAQPAA